MTKRLEPHDSLDRLEDGNPAMPKRLVSAVAAHTAFAARNSKGWEAIGRAVLEGAGQGVDDALVQVRQSGLYRLIAASVASDSE
ncbi:hypothetical protein NKI25_22735 [Mesorhizobium sp. M0808]|uniref:hypothetical protein n=1 Tax=Mesorhizobium sp. M0808 TaxID=2957002 RepID=UPI0033374659